MALQVVLQIDKKELLIGENPLCTLTLRNRGPKTVDVAHPDYGVSMFSFRSIQLVSGDNILSKGQESVRGETPHMVALGSGEEIQTFISLADKITLNIPGEYAVSAIYKTDDGREAVESNVIRLKLRHFSVTNPYFPAVITSDFDSVFIDPSVDPPEVLIAEFNISAGGGLQGIQRIAKAKLSSSPYLSLPPNNNPASHKWFAWLEDGTFKVVFLDGLTEKPWETKLQLETERAMIIPPLAIADATGSSTSSGAALLWLEGNGNDGASIRRIDLTLTGEGPQATGSWSYKLAGERPRWMMSHLLSKGDRLLSFIRTTDSGLGLYLLPWPDQNMQSVSVNNLLDWPQDEFVASGATLNDEDEICGATLVWNSGQEKKILELIVWKVDAQRNAEELYRDVLPWSPISPINAAIVRVRPDGTPAVLMRPDDTRWSVWDSQEKELTPVPAPYFDTKKSIDIGFKDQQEIILICADILGGFALKRMDGSDLPPAFY